MLSKTQIQELARSTLREHGIGMVKELKRGKNYDGENMVALLEIFAEKMESANEKTYPIIEIIDNKMGLGWTRSLAEALSK